jgi:ribose transport system ATP-binding protein
VGTFAAREVTSPELVRAMAGHEGPVPAPRAELRASAPPLLSVRELSAGPVRGVSFEARAGEIVGLAGLMGAGRTETLRAVFGADPRRSGLVEVAGRPAAIASPADAVRHGLAFVSEDRKSQGLLLPHSVRTNLTLTRLRVLATRLGRVRAAAERAAARADVDALGVRCASVEQPVAQLSGGNQQKVLLGRALGSRASVLLLDEPTRGVDAGARVEIHALLRRTAERGAAVVVASSELDELLTLCDRIVVLRGGRVAASFERPAFAREAILAAALDAPGQAARAQG